MTIQTPEDCEDFSIEWVESVTKEYFKRENVKNVKILDVKAKENDLQGILSKTFILDIKYSGITTDDDGVDEEEGEKEKSIFVKVPLKDPNFVSVNVRELIMLQDVLPKLQSFVDKQCIDIIQLPFPEVIHCHYDGKCVEDVFVQGNLLSTGFENLDESKDLNEEHLNSCLDCLSQLHGTGMSLKQSVGGTRSDFLREFPKLEEQIQLGDLLENDELKNFFRRCYKPFLHFLETKEPALKNHTQYMKKFGRYILKIIQVLEKSGYEKLLTLCHGDAKPNNFLFRRHVIDIEELECEGLEAILIDWQGGFLGSIANDLMWVTYPFVESANLRGESGKGLRDKAFEYYFESLQSVLASFNLTLTDLELPESFQEFNAILQKSLVLEFLLVTIIKPIMALKDPNKLTQWYKILDRNQKKGYNRVAKEPAIENIFSSERFPSFCHLYFKIATVLGGFQELGKIFFEVMKDSMFDEGQKGPDSDDEDDESYVSRVINLSIKYWIPVTAILILVVGVLISLIYIYF